MGRPMRKDLSCRIPACIAVDSRSDRYHQPDVEKEADAPSAHSSHRGRLPRNHAAALKPRIEAKADQHGKQRSRRRGHTHGKQRVWKQFGCQIRSGHTNQGDGHDIVDETDIGAPACGEEATEAEMDACEDAVDDIAMKILGPQRNHRRIGGEQTDNGACRQFHDDRYDNAVDDGDRGGVSQRLRRSLHPAGADVLRRDSGYRGQHGRRHQEQRADHLFDDADGGRIVQATVVGDDCDDDEGDLDASILDRRRYADAENAAEHGFIGLKIAEPQLDPRAPAANRHQRHDDADGLRQRGSQCRSRGAEPQPAHEQVVERDVAEACDRNEIHGAFRIAQPAEHRTDDVVRDDERDADIADGQVLRGPFDGFGGHADQRDDVANVQQQNDCQRQGDPREQRDDIADGLGSTVESVRADSTADGDSGAHGKAHNDHGEHIQHLAAVRYRRNAIDADELPGNEQIGHAIQRLQKIRQQIRQREGDDRSEHASRCQVLFHGLSVTLLFKPLPSAGRLDPTMTAEPTRRDAMSSIRKARSPSPVI